MAEKQTKNDTQQANDKQMPDGDSQKHVQPWSDDPKLASKAGLSGGEHADQSDADYLQALLDRQGYLNGAELEQRPYVLDRPLMLGSRQTVKGLHLVTNYDGTSMEAAHPGVSHVVISDNVINVSESTPRITRWPAS